MKDYLLITCVIINYFKELLVKLKPEDLELAASMLTLVNKRNEVQDMILEKNSTIQNLLEKN